MCFLLVAVVKSLSNSTSVLMIYTSERAVSMVQIGMTHQTVADNFKVSRKNIWRLMIRLRQTGRTNDTPRKGRPSVTSQRQDRHVCLIHLRNRMITTGDTARRRPGLANVRISGQTVRRRLRASELRVMNPDFHFVLAIDVILCTAGVANVLRINVYARVWPFWSRKCYRLGCNLSWW